MQTRLLSILPKNKGVFTSDTALEKLVYLAFSRIRKKWTQPVQNWGQTAQQLAIYSMTGLRSWSERHFYLEFLDDINNLGSLDYPVRIGDRAKGTLYYVREEYVAENYMSETNGMIAKTILKLTNRVEYETANMYTGNGVSFDYQDFLR